MTLQRSTDAAATLDDTRLAQSSRTEADPSKIAGLLADLVDHSGGCVAALDESGVVRCINESGRCALDDVDQEMVEGSYWADLWPLGLHAIIADALAEADRGGIATYDGFRYTGDGIPCWSRFAVGAARASSDRPAGYVILYRALTDDELTRRELEMSLGDLRHRVGNSYAMAASLVTAFSRGDTGREQFADEMALRLKALAASQVAFIGTGSDIIPLAVLLHSCLSGFERPGCPIALDLQTGLDVSQHIAGPLAMTVSELATNSSKHGALAGGGDVRIQGERLQGKLVVRWSERSIRPVVRHSRGDGRGLGIMRRIVRAARGTMEVEWRIDGLDATISFD